MTISMGFDPEFFVSSNETGDIVPVCGKLGGTKENPIPFEDNNDYYYHEDNVVAELGVPPAYSAKEAHTILTTGMALLEKELYSKGLNMEYRAQWEFSNRQLVSPLAHVWGCQPDFDAYTGGKSPRLDIPEFGNWRFGGGHVHLGGDFNCPAFVVALFCDLTLGDWQRSFPLAKHRINWYGAPGSYRIKDYGIEYRTLSSVWLPDPPTRELIIRKLWVLCEWLENTSPTKIKEAMDAVSWIAVRDLMRNPKDKTLYPSFNLQKRIARGLGVPI